MQKATSSKLTAKWVIRVGVHFLRVEIKLTTKNLSKTLTECKVNCLFWVAAAE